MGSAAQWLAAAATIWIGCILWLFWEEHRKRMLAEQRSRETEAQLREIQELARIGGWEYDIRTDGIRWSEETFRIFGLPAGDQEPDFADVLLAVHSEDLPRFDRAIQRAITAKEPYRLDLRIHSGDGRLKHIHARGIPIVNRKGEVQRIIGTILDITERKEAELQIAKLASHDVLTGLANRRRLMESLRREILVCERESSSLTICVCDLDRFKGINDTYGHLAGDELLSAFAGMLAKETRAGDLAARMGGDEFCILFPRTLPRQARDCIERIRIHLQENIFTASDGKRYRATATFGVAQLEPGMDDLQVIKAADEALYEAKRLGRNRTFILHEDRPIDQDLPLVALETAARSGD